MNSSPERILLVGNDPDICDQIDRQTLRPLGYEVIRVTDVSQAILEAARLAPDLVIADLDMPGLSGRDLLVALNSQGLQMPVIVIARKGQELKVIQAFRLGACDFLLWPVQEPEVVASVERAFTQVRERRARYSLDDQLATTNQELQQRVRELTTIFAVGKAVISITDQSVLFDKLVEAMVYVAKADYCWLLLRQDQNRAYILSAHRNLPQAWATRVGQQLDDGISGLVAMSGETLAINGEPLKRFKVASLGQSAMAVPLKVQKEVIGLLVVVRKANQPFDSNTQSLLEAVTDYASISLVNARLFRALQQTAEAAQAGEMNKRQELQSLRETIQAAIQPATVPLELLITGKMGKITTEQKSLLQLVQDALSMTESRVKNERSSNIGGE